MCSLKSEGTVKRKNGRLIFDDGGRNPIQHRGFALCGARLTVKANPSPTNRRLPN
jgi:hypothetical protein